MALQRCSPFSKAWLAAVIHLRLSRCHLRTRPRRRRYLPQHQNQLVCLNPTLPTGDLLTLTPPSLHRQVLDSLVIPNPVTQYLPTENENIFLDTLCGLRSLPSLIIGFSCIIQKPFAFSSVLACLSVLSFGPISSRSLVSNFLFVSSYKCQSLLSPYSWKSTSVITCVFILGGMRTNHS